MQLAIRRKYFFCKFPVTISDWQSISPTPVTLWQMQTGFCISISSLQTAITHSSVDPLHSNDVPVISFANSLSPANGEPFRQF
jgi:hypothetical protein